MFPNAYQNNFGNRSYQNNGAQRPHTPEPNPGHNIGRIDYAPRASSFVNGQNIQVATAPDRVVDMQVTYSALKQSTDRNGMPQLDRNTNQPRYHLYIWGRVNRHQMLGVTLRADLNTLQAAAQHLQRGVIVSFTGYVGVGTRNTNGRPDLLFNAVAYGDLKQGEITVPFNPAAAAPMPAPAAYPAQYGQPQAFMPPQNFIPQSVMPQAPAPIAAPPQMMVPANAPVAAPAEVPAAQAEAPAPSGTAPF